ADRNRSHWSTSKTPSYTKSVSWQHHRMQMLPVFMRVRERQNRKKTTLGIYKEKALSMQRLEGGLFHLMTRFSTSIRA
ncbi:hypothetical protein, partial [Escherichia coli]|uniref:hypothetical protein n=1 Tax=Escherichia coli TaxID=562 RepID=UPI001A7E14B5